ncbi:hypothetical protein OBV_17140 [Oscillibacter valericigenes Sjm18-20]|nr:hypothetical protein OBV_17140 [Oscillibacter valericigenes Sjm18-20]
MKRRYKHNLSYWFSALFFLALVLISCLLKSINYVVIVALIFCAGREIYWFFKDNKR